MPNFTYTRDRPAGDLSPAAQRGTLVTNTNSVDSILEVDLYGFNDNNGGHHQKSTYVVQGADPTPVDINGAQGILYAKTANAIAELYVTRFGEATAVQLTKGGVTIDGGSTNPLGAKGHTFLPGGIILQWGSLRAATSGSPFTFSVAFTAIYSIVGTVQATGAEGCAFSGVNINGGTIYAESATQQVNYIAIGI